MTGRVSFFCRGRVVQPMLPVGSGTPSTLAPQTVDWDLLLTAETHNFPCAVAPYPGERSCLLSVGLSCTSESNLVLVFYRPCFAT